MIKKNKFLLYDIDHSGMTPLMRAVKRGHYELVELLIKSGSFVDHEDFLGRTALYFALLNQQQDILRLLLMNKAYPWNSNHSYDKLCWNTQVLIAL